MKIVTFLAFVSCLAASAQGQTGNDFTLNMSYTVPADNTRVVSPPSMVSVKKAGGETKGAAPRDDVKPRVLAHLNASIDYCDSHMDDCNGGDGAIRAFAKTIGNGRCNNRGYNCVRGVLEMCKGQLEGTGITPMYYMACGAMLGKLGERDCAEGRASCAKQLQGALYFSLRASAACYKSYEEEPEKQGQAGTLMNRFATSVNGNVKDISVKDVAPAHSTTHILVWDGAREAATVATEKVLEFAFERLAMHGAGAVVGAIGTPLLAFSGFMLFHEIAAAQMHDEVCGNWSSYYNGNYSNVATSVQRMTAKVK